MAGTADSAADRRKERRNRLAARSSSAGYTGAPKCRQELPPAAEDQEAPIGRCASDSAAERRNREAPFGRCASDSAAERRKDRRNRLVDRSNKTSYTRTPKTSQEQEQGQKVAAASEGRVAGDWGPLRRLEKFIEGEGAPVTLHLYDLAGDDTINVVLDNFNAGAFHAAVEVYGLEWSFGAPADEDDDEASVSPARSGWVSSSMSSASPSRQKVPKAAKLAAGSSSTELDAAAATGVFSCRPKKCSPHKYRESVAMGHTGLTQADVERVLEVLADQWPGCSYDLLGRNCCHFSNAFCLALGVGPIPERVTNLAGAGAKVQGAAISAAAKAIELDEEYRIRAQVGVAVAPLGEALCVAAGQVGELDAHYNVSASTGQVVSSAAEQAGAVLAAVAAGARENIVPEQVTWVNDQVAEWSGGAIQLFTTAVTEDCGAASGAVAPVVAARPAGRTSAASAVKVDDSTGAGTDAKSSDAVHAGDRPRPPPSAAEPA